MAEPIRCYACGAEQARGPSDSSRCAVCGEPEGLLTAVEMLAERTCIHCGSRGVVDVPIDNEMPDEEGREIRAWSCVDCAHKRVRFDTDQPKLQPVTDESFRQILGLEPWEPCPDVFALHIDEINAMRAKRGLPPLEAL